MEEIKLGEYVRNKDGIIRRVISIDEHNFYLDKFYYEKNEVEDIYEGYDFMFDSEIVKHSENIIDLIEEGDYVNGYYVEKVWEQVNYRMAIDLRGSTLGLNDENCIKSIVTKEQFNQVKYEV